jgi:hypothetical protein
MAYGRFEVLSTWHERMRGLLGPRARGRPVLLERCRSIHTFGMRYAIDVALGGEGGEVLFSARRLGASCVASAVGARLALERPASEGQWPEEGELLVFEECEKGDATCVR